MKIHEIEADAGARLARFLQDGKADIVDAWESAARRLPRARPLDPPSLRDEVPELLDEIRAAAQALADGRGFDDGAAPPAPMIAERRVARFDFAEVVDEYAVLRETLLARWDARGGDPLARRLIDRLIDRALTEAARRYTRARRGLLEALAAITAAGSGDRPLGEQLQGLLDAFLVPSAGVDTASILLREGDHLVVRAAAGLERDSVGERATAIGAPLHHFEVRARYEVPLLAGDAPVGVAQMGSLTSFQFSEEDQALFRALADRAASMVTRARLLAEERALREEAQRTNALMETFTDSATVGLAFLDTALRYQLVNRELAVLHGAPPAAHIGRTVRDMFPAYADAIEPKLRQVLASRHPEHIELRVASSDGETIRHGDIYPVVAASGELLGVGAVVADVTASRRREAALRESQLRYRRLSEAGIIGIVEWRGRNGRVTAANDAFLHMIGYGADDVATGKLRLDQLTAPEMRERIEKELRVLFETGVLHPMEKQLLRRDGRRVDVIVAGATLDPDGERGIELMLDLSERKRAEQALAESEERGRAIIASLHEGVVMQDRGGRFITCNPSAQRILGVDRAGVYRWGDARRGALREDGRPFTPGDEPPLVALRTGVPQRDVTVGVRRADGSLIWLLVNCEPLAHPGEAPYAVVTSMVDVTDRLRWERELARSEARFRTVVLASSHMVWTTDARLALIGDSPAWRAFTGQSTEEFARPFGWLEAVHPDDRERARLRLRAAMARRARFDSELRVRRLDGDWRDMLVRIVPVRDASGTVREWVATLVDVSDNKRAQVERERLYQQAQQAVAVRDNVMAIVSHDLKNPLTAVAASAAMLARSAVEAGDERAGRLIDTVRRAARRMERLIGDLVDMAAIEAGGLSVRTSPHEVAALVAEAAEAHEPIARERGILFRADAPTGRVLTLCDRGRVLQVLGNLLANALKVCRAGEHVSVAATVRNGEVVFAVSDTGPGIPGSDLPHIFNRYWTAERRDGGGGTGLGLYISKGIVEAHGGRIWAESRVGGGSTFYFTLPRAP